MIPAAIAIRVWRLFLRNREMHIALGTVGNPLFDYQLLARTAPRAVPTLSRLYNAEFHLLTFFSVGASPATG